MKIFTICILEKQTSDINFMVYHDRLHTSLTKIIRPVLFISKGCVNNRQPWFVISTRDSLAITQIWWQAKHKQRGNGSVLLNAHLLALENEHFFRSVKNFQTTGEERGKVRSKRAITKLQERDRLGSSKKENKPLAITAAKIASARTIQFQSQLTKEGIKWADLCETRITSKVTHAFQAQLKHVVYFLKGLSSARVVNTQPSVGDHKSRALAVRVRWAERPCERRCIIYCCYSWL